MFRVYGLHLCHIQVCLHVCWYTWQQDYSGELSFYWSFFLPGVIYLPGRWILISSSTCMTSCEPAVNKGRWNTATVRQMEDLYAWGWACDKIRSWDCCWEFCGGKLIQLFRCPLVVIEWTYLFLVKCLMLNMYLYIIKAILVSLQCTFVISLCWVCFLLKENINIYCSKRVSLV